MDMPNVLKLKMTPCFEQIKFETELPCRIRTKNVMVNTMGTLHYATTMEIVLTDRLDGVVTVGACQYDLNPKGRHVFVIPPNVVHSTFYRASDGREYVFKISFEILSRYFNTEEIFFASGFSFEEIPYDFSEMYDEFFGLLVEQMKYEENLPIDTLKGLLELYRLIGIGVHGRHEKEATGKTDPKILEILQWTKEHMAEDIKIDDVADNFHYSKYYFCRFFKKHTGKTYNEYINTLRVNHAIELMKQGKSATFCCMECGFDDLSYFIKLFKKKFGMSPSQYRSYIVK